MIKQQLEDTFEKLVEQGTTQTKKAVKSAVQQVTSTVSVNKMWEQILGVPSNTPDKPATTNPPGNFESRESVNSTRSHTPLNLDKLAKSYQFNDKQKTDALKQHLFELVRRGDEKLLFDKKQAEQEKKKKEAYDLEMKKKKEEDNQKQTGELPQGKVKKSIFSHKKVAQRQHAELKPSSGKQ